MRSMSILFVTHYSEMLGANRSLLALVDGLQDRGHRVEVVAPSHGELTEQLLLANIPWRCIPSCVWFHVPSNRPYGVLRFARWGCNFIKRILSSVINAISAIRLARYAQREGVDIIYTNSITTPLGLWASYLVGIPHIWHVREFGERDYQMQPDFGWKLLYKALKSSHQVIAISKAIAEFHGISKMPQGQVIYNGLIDDTLNPPECIKSSDEITICIVGYISPQKGQEVAIKAFAKFAEHQPTAKLIVVGDGESSYVESLKKLASSLNVKNKVQFLGYLSDPSEVYAKSKIALMCSESEGFGRVTVEAMWHKCIVVGYNRAGTAEIIDHGVNGLLYETEQELLDTLISVSRDKERMEKLALAGQRDVAVKYTVDAYVSAVESTYLKALN